MGKINSNVQKAQGAESTQQRKPGRPKGSVSTLKQKSLAERVKHAIRANRKVLRILKELD